MIKIISLVLLPSWVLLCLAAGYLSLCATPCLLQSVPTPRCASLLAWTTLVDTAVLGSAVVLFGAVLIYISQHAVRSLMR